jgi:hypothetical protein
MNFALVIIASAIASFGAVDTPTFTINSMELSLDELTELTRMRAQYQQDVYQRLRDLSQYVVDANAVEVRETKATALMADGALKKKREARTVRIVTGSGDRVSVAVAELKAAVSEHPTLNDARKWTVRKIYDPSNPDAPVLIGNEDANDTLSLEESRLPGFVFDLIDTGGDGEISLAEAGAYWDGLG